MSSVRSCVILSTASSRLVMPAMVGERDETGYFASSIVGWYGHPDLKVTQVERRTGDGAFPVPERDVLYAARTVTIGVTMRAASRGRVLALVEGLLALQGRSLTAEVQDDQRATAATGYARVEVSDGMHAGGATATVTVVCPDPRRYGTVPHTGVMVPPSASGVGGLVWGPSALRWPIDWGPQAASRSLCTTVNDGTATAYPTISVSGSMPRGFAVTDQATGLQLSYRRPVSWQPVVIDCLSRTASVAGVDVTRYLAARHFPSVAPGGSLTLSLAASGSGAATVEVRDTYI